MPDLNNGIRIQTGFYTPVEKFGFTKRYYARCIPARKCTGIGIKKCPICERGI
jgi:hypothetical protein